MDRLKLLALDEADLAIVSACLQDAVFKASDTAFKTIGKDKPGAFTLESNRFVWEAGDKAKEFARRRAVLAVKRVLSVRSLGVDRTKSNEVLSLLALRFLSGKDAPMGTVELVLSGGGVIALDVECIEVELADVSGSWGTEFKPRHPG